MQLSQRFPILISATSLLLFMNLGAQPAAYQEAIVADSAQAKRDSVKWEAAPQSMEVLASAPVTLIPFPRKVTWSKGNALTLSNTASILIADKVLDGADRALIKELGEYGIKPSRAKATEERPAFSLALDPDKVTQPEGYQLVITQDACSIVAHDPAGAFYAVQTLAQMLRKSDDNITLPACQITDYPAFKLRGFMHDTGRNYQTVESLKKQIDRFADYKLNVFHWHLTDNPAWRVESKVYPQLNDPENRRKGRDENSSYSFDQIRDVIAYAKQRYVMIIPELDMPGHSQYFPKTFGFKMETPQGMEVLEKLIDEFCEEIPAEDCPYLHLGADEVHIENPSEFIQRMSRKVREHKRIPMLWNPGLKPTDDKTVMQLWRDESYSGALNESSNPIVDSGGGYVNAIDPQLIVQRYFFWQACRQPEGDEKAIGGILCHWPDVNIDDKENIFKHSPVWPGLLAFSEAIWQGRSLAADNFREETPERGSQAWLFFREFEARVADHRDRFFEDEHFPYVKQAGVEWSVTDAFAHDKNDPWTKSFAPETDPERECYSHGDKTIGWHPLNGATVKLPRKNTPLNATRYLKTYLHSDRNRTTFLMIGFDTSTRSTRRSGGIPRTGQWDANGGSVWLNGKEIPPPQWKMPGQRRYEYHTWGKAPNEIPYVDEEFYWCREPIRVQLKKGANLILMRVPLVYKDQSYQATCLPVKKHGNRWVEDESITSSITQ